jgi:adenosine kinase
LRIVVTGSIATDHLMRFPGKFGEHLLAEHLDHVSLSFLVDELEIRRGGCAANISFGLGLLGVAPMLIGAVGQDFADYDAWLRRHGVDTSAVLVSANKHTARFVCTTDEVGGQLASFYTGAMSDAALIELAPVAARAGGLDLVVISPNDPQAMIRHTDECRALGYPFVADPSQQLARADRDMVRSMVDGAAYLFTNEYEAGLLVQKSGWSPAEILSRAGCWVVTRGADGATIEREDADPVSVGVVEPARIADPTGVGDAFRAGYLAGIGWGLDDKGCAQLGSAMASLALEVVGPQEYQFDVAEFSRRLIHAFGDDANDVVAATLGGDPAMRSEAVR